jgi:phenylpropionate dioxygenase-like ring-hydroxylating dioxygenase large terminal subunit
VREADGVVWVAPAAPEGGDAEPDRRAEEHVLTNVDPSLRSGWHPVALASELPATVRLLGETYGVTASPDGIRVEPSPAAVAERFGVVFVAPEPPRAPLLDVPEADDPQYARGRLVPERSASPAGVLAENFLDVAHFPFVHAGTFGAAEETYVEPFDVTRSDDGLLSVQEQWFDNPGDPGVAAGVRPVRQRRRATYAYRWPFQLSLRLEELDAGAVKTIVFLLQPEDAGATRIYTIMLLHGIGGVAVPPPDVVAAEVAFEVAVLDEDLRLQQAMTVGGLPLRLRDELHVRSDRSGVALRRVLAAFLDRPDT